MKMFETGATRSDDHDRPDPEGYLSPLVLQRFSEYMLRHQYQADGTKRESDNWQKGMPLASHIKGLCRHFLHLWLRHRGWPITDSKAEPSIEDDLCAIIFNAQGYLHELLKKRLTTHTTIDPQGRYVPVPIADTCEPRHEPCPDCQTPSFENPLGRPCSKHIPDPYRRNYRGPR